MLRNVALAFLTLLLAVLPATAALRGMADGHAIRPAAVSPSVRPEAVEFLGEKAEPEIRSGCVVYGGEYLPPPYVVKRMGNEVFINEMSVRWFVPWPIPKNLGWGRTKVMPAITDDINEDSSEWDESVGKFCWGLLDHLIYLGITNRAERYAAEVKKLPCVISACVRGDGKVVIDWKKGTKGVGTNVYPDRYSRGSKKWPQDKKTLQEMGGSRSGEASRRAAR